MKDENRLWLILALIAGVCILLGQTGCTLSAEQRARTTLNTMALVIDPASKTAHDLCAASLKLEDARVKADVYETRAEAQAAHDAVAEPCQKTASVFATISALYDKAVDAIEAGDIKSAQQFIAHLRAAWKQVHP